MSNIRAFYNKLASVNHTEEIKEAGVHAIEGGAVGFALATIAKNRAGGLEVEGKPADLIGGIAGLALAPYLPVSASMKDRVRRMSEVAFGIGVYNRTASGAGRPAAPRLPAHGDAAILDAARRL
jgi:hypothetical protein